MENKHKERAIELLENNEGYARTGCTLLDCVVGGGTGLGFPFGRIVNFVGDKSSGKTFVSNELIAANFHEHKKNFKWNYDDSESGYTFNTMSLYNFDIMKTDTEDTLFSSTVEELDVNVFDFLKKFRTDKQKGIYVVDSLDGLSNSEVQEREAERAAKMKKCAEKGEIFTDKGSYQMKSQKFLSQEFFRTKAEKLHGKNVLLIFVSQIRDKIDAGNFQRKWTRAGGKALDFYAHSVVVLGQVTKIKVGERPIGLVLKAKTDKSKTARPYRECTFSLYFDYGIDNIGSNLDFLFDLRGKDGKLLKAAESINFNGVQKNLKSYKTFLTERELYDQLKKQKKEETGKTALTLEYIEDFIENDEKLKKEAAEYFGESMSRTELIEKAEQDPEFFREIEIRTIAKWEAAEDEVRTKRKGKYE